MAMEQSAVVVGGGMVGAATACALQLQGIPVTLIDPYPPVLDEALPSEYAIRVSALTLASKHILQSLGAWDYITAARLQPFQQMHVWDAQGNGEIHFHGDDISQPYLGYLVENFVVQKALWQRLQQLSVCTIKASVESISPLGSKGEHRLVLDDGAELRASLVIAADGANSPLRKMLGIEMAQHDYQHTAIVATVKPELSHDNTAWQRFLSTGPLAFLPLPEGFCSIVWSTTPEQADTLMSLPDEAFELQLTQAFDGRLGKVQVCSQRGAHPLTQRHVSTYVQPGIALVGDAAHTIHPLAGQGVNLGLLDAASIAEVVGSAFLKKQNIGEHLVLRRYERWRKGNNAMMMSAMSAFKSLFSHTLLPVTLVRNLGLKWMNRAKPLKREIMLNAVGLRGDLPDMAKPYFKARKS